MAQFRQLSEFCEFGDTLNDMFCDQLVCGITDSSLQRRLLLESSLTLQKVFKLAEVHTW